MEIKPPSLLELQNRTFQLFPDWLEKNILPLPDKDNKFKYFNNPLIGNTEVMFNFELDLDGQGKLEVYTFVTEHDEINHYLLLYKFNNGSIYWSPFRSLTEYPRVWDRHFNFGPDYLDWLQIQKVANWVLSGIDGMKQFEINKSKENKSIFKQELKDGKYQNLSLKAEAVQIKELNKQETEEFLKKSGGKTEMSYIEERKN